MFALLAAGFLFSTILMVGFFVFLGILEWRDTRNDPVMNANGKPRSRPVAVPLPIPVPAALPAALVKPAGRA